jgi:hypothetical protein
LPISPNSFFTRCRCGSGALPGVTAGRKCTQREAKIKYAISFLRRRKAMKFLKMRVILK